MIRDIVDRTFNFGIQIIKLSEHIPASQAGKICARQVLRSGTSIGANIEEAEAAYTKDVFTYKMNIALSEARETYYWLRLLKGSDMIRPNQIDTIINEADELRKILGAIVSSARGKSKR
jgi:four helix bundle protein